MKPVRTAPPAEIVARGRASLLRAAQHDQRRGTREPKPEDYFALLEYLTDALAVLDTYPSDAPKT